MITYFIEIIVFQLVFFLLFDFALSKDTFHQWKRIYLLGTFIVSLILPLVSLDFLQLQAVYEFSVNDFSPVFLENIVIAEHAQEMDFSNLTILKYTIVIGGATIAGGNFLSKILQIRRLKNRSVPKKHADYTEFLVSDSRIAFSFLGMIFLGDKINGHVKENIIRHELVHIRQRHSIDLLFFEIMRIPFWFNPMVYLYQQRITELHEFIADEQVSRYTKRDLFNHLLNEVFQTKNISFINQFFKKSLIKKRIIMLEKKKTSPTLKSKYLIVLPVLATMLFYTSCKELHENHQVSEAELKINEETTELPFMVVEEVPVFPGCENAMDRRSCFIEKIQTHIRNNFNYPREAREKEIEGIVYALFKIDEKGNIADIRTRGPHKSLEDEVNLLIKSIPQMKPGKHKGKVTSVPFSIPVTFELN